MFKKMLLTLAMVALLVAPAMAGNYYYYEDEAVSGGYSQSGVPIQGVAINGALAYGDFGMSADFVALQALPMTQSMFGTGNAGVMTQNTYKYESTQVNFDRVEFAANGGWNGDYYDYYYGYNYYNISIYNPQYNYYYYYPIYNQSGHGEYNVDFSWTSLGFYKSSNENSYVTTALPAVLETSTSQGFSNSLTFEAPGMKLKMDQTGVQAGSLKVIGYGNAHVSQGCN